MIILYTLCILCFISTIAFLNGCVRGNEDIARGAGLLALVTFGILICMVPDIEKAHIEFDYIKEKYYNLERQINTIEYDVIVTDKNLRNQVLEMNNIISEHKVKSKNIWVDAWYSEEIGKLKPLEWKSKKGE